MSICLLNMQLLDGEQTVWSIPKSPDQHQHPQKPVCSKLCFDLLLIMYIVRGGNGSWRALKRVLKGSGLNQIGYLSFFFELV